MKAKNQNVVRYDSKLNQISFSGFSDSELSLFFAIVSKLKYKGENEIILSFSSLQDLTGVTRHESNRELAARLAKLGEKLLKLNASAITDSSFIVFNLFEEFEANWETSELSVQVSKRFLFLFNEFLGMQSWTRFELSEFVSLRGKHAKNLYRLLKQWRTAGQFSISVREFKRLLSVESYSTDDLTKRVIKPSVQKIAQLSGFHDLRWRYSYATKKKAIRVIFWWTPVNPDIIRAKAIEKADI